MADRHHTLRATHSWPYPLALAWVGSAPRSTFSLLPVFTSVERALAGLTALLLPEALQAPAQTLQEFLSDTAP